MQYLSFWVALISLSIMFSGFIYVVACARISFPIRLNNSIMCTDDILFIYSSINGHLGCFLHLGYCEYAAMNMGVQISVHVPAFNYFGYMPTSGIAESYDNSIFNLLRNCHSVFHSGCSILHFLVRFLFLPLKNSFTVLLS